MMFLRSLYGKISVAFLVLLLILGAIQVYVTTTAYMNFAEESEQKLNLNLAHAIALDFEPFVQDSIDYDNIKHMMHYLMVVNPSIEIYLLDDAGGILAFFADPEKKIQLDRVRLDPIRQFIEGNSSGAVSGDDPRHTDRQKTFSAAPIRLGAHTSGFVYVILRSEQYDSASAMLEGSYIFKTTLLNLLMALLFAAAIGLGLFFLLTKKFRLITDTVQDFQTGDYTSRIPVTSNDEFGQLARTINEMADRIVDHLESIKQVDHLRRELIANISHDLRSPLTSMQGYIETIMMKEDTLSIEERRKFMQVIFENTMMLSRLVGDLFELSKLDSKQVQPKIEDFSIAEITQDLIMKFDPIARQKNIQLHMSFPPNLSFVRGDIALIDRAMSNLTENAIRYTPEEGRVNIDLSNRGSRVQVVVSDTGCGIPETELPFIFDRFYRGRISASGEKPESAGLGLAITKKILETHNENIQVESTVGAGTKFIFHLDAVQSN